jgi:opacity protein-like surface antigen
MAIVTRSAPIAALVVLFLLAPSLAVAQDERLRVSFAPAVATVGGDGELALGGTLGYRFSDHFWFEGEFTWIDAAADGFRDNVLEFDGRQGLDIVRALTAGRSARFGSGRFGGSLFPNLSALPGFGQYRASIDGETLIGTLGIRYELPVQTARFRPYVAGGLGINNTEQDFDIERLVDSSGVESSVSHTGYAVSAGAGASIRMFRSLWADMDAKYFRLSRDRNIMRLGGGVSLRF